VDRPQRLVLVIPSLGAGGAERVLSTLANEWVQRGHDVVLITLTSTGNDFFPLDRKIRRAGLDLALNPRGGRWLTVNAARVNRLRSAIASAHPDVVVSFLDAANLLTVVATRRLDVRVVVSVRANPTTQDLKLSHRVLRRTLYPRASAVVMQTQEAAGWALRFVPAEKVFVIPNPATPPPHAPPAEREQNVAALGRLLYEKGFDLLIDAFARCSARHPDWSLTIAGDGPELPALVEQATALGVRDRIRFPGVIAEPHLLFSRSSLFVLPSRQEGFPMALLEAMGSSLPVIAADCRFGPRTIVRNGVDGILVPAEDSAALAAAMAKLMDAPAERQRLARQAAAVLERFGLSSVADRWEELFAALPKRR